MDSEAPDPDEHVSLDLPAHADSASRARAVVAQALDRWRLPQLIDACQLAATELVTNAVRHGRPPVGLSLRRKPATLRLDVRDSAPAVEMPEPPEQAYDPDAEGGRGLRIVAAISDDSGVEAIPNDGKSIYAAWNVRAGQSSQRTE